VDGVLEIKLFDNLKSIVRIRIHFVTYRGLGRATVAATIVSNHAIAVGQKEHHLGVPVV
jgi:hypothetical protein